MDEMRQSLVGVVTELLIVVHLPLALAPMLLAPRTHKDKCHPVLRWLSEAHGLVVSAVVAFDVLSALQSRVLDTLGVDLEVLCTHREISPVDTIVNFATLDSWSVIVTQLALELKEASIWIYLFILFGVEHVVTLGAEAHALKLEGFATAWASCCRTVLRHGLACRRNHVSCLHYYFS